MSVNGRISARKGDEFTNDAEGYALPNETQSHFQTECTSYRNFSEFCALSSMRETYLRILERRSHWMVATNQEHHVEILYH